MAFYNAVVIATNVSAGDTQKSTFVNHFLKHEAQAWTNCAPDADRGIGRCRVHKTSEARPITIYLIPNTILNTSVLVIFDNVYIFDDVKTDLSILIYTDLSIACIRIEQKCYQALQIRKK